MSPSRALTRASWTRAGHYPGACMRRLVALTLALAAAPATPALAARTLTIRQPRAPQVTLTVPAGWHTHVARRRVTFRRGRERVRVVQCPLDREERDMTGDHAARLRHKLARGIYGERDDLAAAAAGGSCVLVTGKGALALARRLHPRLGPP